MKKVLFAAAAAGLMSLGACTPAANNTVAADNTVANVEEYTDTNTVVVDNTVATVETNTVETNTVETNAAH